jgi:hypothetical protein
MTEDRDGEDTQSLRLLMRRGSPALRSFLGKRMSISAITGGSHRHTKVFDLELCAELGLDSVGVARRRVGEAYTEKCYEHLMEVGDADIRREALSRFIHEDWLFKSSMKTIPEELGDFPDLTYVDLDGPESIPNSIGELHKLARLEISSEELQRLPESMANLKSLKYVTLSGLSLGEMPSWLVDLPAVEELDFSGNGIQCLPENIDRMQSLRTLKLLGNQLQTLPESFAALANLRELRLDGNPFGEFPRVLLQMPWLEELDLDRCGLSEIPLKIERMTGLRKLWIRNPALQQEVWSLQELLPNCEIHIG